MGKSSKFYKKPSLKEKQAVQGKVRSSTSSSAGASSSSAPVFKQGAIKKAALTGKALEKRQALEQKSREKEEATRAAKPVFRQGGAVSSIEQEDQNNDLDMAEDDADVIKRRPRNRQRKDWGPMPREVGIDYLKQWDNRS
ncbi:hypothetical protein PHSY_004752 [Pseudozyma hubeiensis SY62]|uniref:Uncharacterized protein n=1 Tax=Pseudozyma hubeiensis (strain SY62) TaxID=1305764 RepID=R9P7D6_PSEHS|nr:hypothetical protein PHSY_004752 [Pseudozyma hubeiensis SY62]GAC97167.1 hypothetical protein PHSY_004752 [Pseudozyma hubeiensis SY62]